jgi:integrase
VTRLRLQFVHEYIDRHGRVRRYVRKSGRHIPLPGLPGSPEFMEAYQAALRVTPVLIATRKREGSLAALVEHFVQSTEFVNLKAGSQKTYRKALGPVLAAHGHRMISDLEPDKARKVIENIGARAPGMANLTRSVLVKLFNYAVDIGLRRDNPFVRVPRYRLGKHHTWTESELFTYERRWPLGTRERLAYAILLYTVQRVGDAVRMQRSHVTDGALHLIQDKTGAELAIPLHPALNDAIKAGPSLGLYLIGDRAGRPIKAPALSALILTAAKAAGLPRECVAHGLRKAGMRRLAEHGCTTKQIAAMSGHKSLREIERYTAAAEQKKLATQAVRKLRPREQTVSG